MNGWTNILLSCSSLHLIFTLKRRLLTNLYMSWLQTIENYTFKNYFYKKNYLMEKYYASYQMNSAIFPLNNLV
jgi:hypothetical protein